MLQERLGVVGKICVTLSGGLRLSPKSGPVKCRRHPPLLVMYPPFVAAPARYARTAASFWCAGSWVSLSVSCALFLSLSQSRGWGSCIALGDCKESSKNSCCSVSAVRAVWAFWLVRGIDQLALIRISVIHLSGPSNALLRKVRKVALEVHSFSVGLRDSKWAV